MPDPNKKISTPSKDSPCEIKLACSAETRVIKTDKGNSQKEGKGCKSTAMEKQATLNKEPCPSGTACHLARPDRSVDPASRIDKKKPGCINFESCEEEQEKTEEPKLESGCIDYEDCQDYLKEEKRRLKQMKDDEKKKKKEELANAKAERKNKCSN